MISLEYARARKGRGMLKTWVGYNLGQDFINIFLLVLCKKIIILN